MSLIPRSELGIHESRNECWRALNKVSRLENTTNCEQPNTHQKKAKVESIVHNLGETTDWKTLKYTGKHNRPADPPTDQPLSSN